MVHGVTGEARAGAGEKLLSADGREVSASDLKGKTVGLYFSAGWCQPCKVFTPQLIQVRGCGWGICRFRGVVPTVRKWGSGL